MVSVSVFNRTGGEVDKVEVDLEAIAPRINKQLLHDVVVMYQANRRQGTARTKTRGEVAGSTKKMYRQKGTGNARAGGRRSGVRRGGGHIFAIRQRNYGYRLPRKAIQLATRMAIASKVADGQFVVIDELTFDKPTTREMVHVLSALKIAGKSTLVAVPQHDVNVWKSGRNIAGVEVRTVADLNAFLVLQPERMLVTRAALNAILERCAAAGGRSERT